MTKIAFPSAYQAPDPLQDPAAALLDLWPAAGSMPGAIDQRIRSRLGRRLARALQSGSRNTTLRRERVEAETVVPGVTRRPLYASSGAALRPGEPALAVVLELAAGARWTVPLGGCREWLVMRGSTTIGQHQLGALGFLRECGTEPLVSSAGGALIYLRQVPAEAKTPTAAQHDRPEAWLPFAPGIVRRLLWTDGQQAAMLYRTVAGAAVPHHGHGYDEECLMIDGELFLDDVLLRPGDYQLAPAGTEHAEVSTDTGCLLFAHGDLELQLVRA